MTGGALSAIGNTPAIRLTRLAPNVGAEIWVKWEGANPTGSMKDRMALSMIEGAEQRGELRSGGRVVEYTGGSTGSSLAMVCAAKGYAATFVSSDAFAEEKLQTMRAFGAEVEVIPSENRQITPELVTAIVERARELSSEPGTFWADQYNNVDNRSAYHRMAEEILSQLEGRVDAFVQSSGTGVLFGKRRDPQGCRPRHYVRCRRARFISTPVRRRARRSSHRGDRTGVRPVDHAHGPRRRHRLGIRRGCRGHGQAACAS
jgi:cysteine synthase